MTEQIGLWRATYSPGEWIVLGGPTSLVVLQPAPAQSSPLVEVLWEVVLHASSLDDLVAELAKHNVSKMPDFAAFFWHGGEMRSLIRGELRIVDLDSGDVVAAGADVQTWNEVGLGLVRRVRVDLGAEQHTQGELLRLPLVVGAVAASALELDATGAALVSSPQPTAFPAAKPADAAAREAAVLPMPAQEPVAELESARSAVVDAVVVEDSAMLEPGAAEEPARLDRGLDDQPPAVARRRAEPVEEGPDTGAGPEPDAAASDTEESGTEEPGTEEPGTEEPGTEEPSTEEPGTEEKPEADEKVGERWDPFGRTEAYQAFPEDADDSASADAFSPADESGPESDEPRRGAAADPFAPQVSRDPHNPFELSIVQDREDDVAVPPPGHNPFAVPSAGASPFDPPG